MGNIAVPGGLGSVGKTIVEVLNEDPKHNVIILSRKAHGNSPVPVKMVDYDNIKALKDLLEANEIHTVISALSLVNESVSRGQINLIKAAAMATPTKRFVASEWGVPFPKGTRNLPFLEFHVAALDELRKTDLEWTRFHNGYFLDYYGIPHIKTYMAPLPFVIDVDNKFAAIPGTGDDVVTFIYAFDLARFVRAALDLPAGEWPETSIVIGDKLTFNELLKLAEEARGSAFEVRYDPQEKLNNFKITELPAHRLVYTGFYKEQLQRTFSVFEQWVVAGLFDLQAEKSLNVKFPEIKPLKAKEMLEQVWKGK